MGAPIYTRTGADDLAGRLFEETGGRIVLAVPLGLGKPAALVNALTRRAGEDPGLELTILTALSLEIPKPGSDLERRFAGPLYDRLFEGVEPLDYTEALRRGTLPGNIEIVEFFFQAGRWLKVDRAQQSYTSTNYSDACDLILARGANVVAQLVAVPDGEAAESAETLSLSPNPDITLDLLAARDRGEAQFALVGQVSDDLPFMPGDAALSAGAIQHLLTAPDVAAQRLFNVPKRPIDARDYAAGLYASRLVADGGTIQIGIGSMGDAIAQSLVLRHAHNTAYRELMDRLPGPVPGNVGGLAAFETGLYGASEMLVDSFLDLIDADILKREIAGCVLNAAFFLGPRSLYRRLSDMPPAQRARIGMTSVRFTNRVWDDFDRKSAERPQARFFNNVMMATLMGAAVSDGLEDGRVVSGVGGQFDFVEQAFQLPGARSVLLVPAVRETSGKAQSNILWSYGHVTVPRQMRDIVVSEYGVANLRGKSDADTIAAMIAIADTRFQGGLVETAKGHGKLASGFRAPAGWARNTRAEIDTALAPAVAEGLLPAFPFGSDFTPVEQMLLPALDRLRSASGNRGRLARLAWAGATGSAPSADETEALARMGLKEASTFAERLYRWLVIAALRQG